MQVALDPHSRKTLSPAEPLCPASCRGCPVRERGICRALDLEGLRQMARVSNRRVVLKGEPIHREHGQGEGVASIVSGVVSLSRGLPDGRHQIVGLQFPPRLLGAVPDRDHKLDAVARDNVRLCAIARRDFEGVLSRFPGLEHEVLRQVGEQLGETQNWLLAIGRKSAAERVATFLEMVARHRSQTGFPETPIRVALPLSRGAMADFLGLTIETVSRKMSELRRAGVIDFSDAASVRIVSPARLLMATGDSSELGLSASPVMGRPGGSARPPMSPAAHRPVRSRQSPCIAGPGAPAAG